MHELFLMRHAKAEDAYRGSDHARRLTERGRRQAAEAGALLRPHRISAALVSSATRTKETAEALKLGCPIELSDRLYNCGTDTMRSLIAQTDEQITSLIVVAHSPATPVLAGELAGPGADLNWFPTASFAWFKLACAWGEFKRKLRGPASGVELVEVHRAD